MMQSRGDECAVAAFRGQPAEVVGPVLAGTRRLVVSGPSSDERRVRLRAAFLATQVAISIVLLVGAALFARGIARATTLVPEAIDAVVRVQVTGLTGTSQDQQAAWRQLYEALRDRLGPDARHHVAVAHPTWWTSVAADDRTMNGVSVRRVSPEFFRLLRIQLLAGDLCSDTSDPADVVVNESLSRALWPGQSALGRIISAGDMGSPQREPRRVIGVVSDSRWFDATEPGPALFVRDFGVLLVRNESAILDAVRGTAAEVMPEAQVFFLPARPGNITNYVVASSLAAALGLIALGMATAGTFGVLMYLFTQRTREIAVRVALGARAAHVARLLTSEAFGALTAGAMVGFVISALGAPVLRAYLLGLGPYDPPAYLAAVAVLALAMAAASIAPLRRALAIDPAITLRQD